MLLQSVSGVLLLLGFLFLAANVLDKLPPWPSILCILLVLLLTYLPR